jgi:hypothetical protein
VKVSIMPAELLALGHCGAAARALRQSLQLLISLHQPVALER